MPKGTNQKLKLYRLAQIMLENTDDEHYITMPEIMEELGKYEVTADRKTIYADLRDLSVLGIEVEGEPIGNRYHYRVVNRPFELPEEDQHTDKKAGKAGQQIRCTEAAATGVCIRKN